MGQIIGERFEVGEPLGQGGMGTVYHGIDTRTGQPVAIKLLRTEVVAANPGLVERFAREGEALRRLNHPNIVKMLATVEENGSHYLVMEYVEGGSLAELLQSAGAPLPVDRVLHIALELTDALTRAHHLKIIHRDIKPANVLIAEDGTPRLTDFGIARMDDQSRVTESGVVVGTFSYLSPEACQGRPLDARTDIWAFGVLLYEMLAGRRPFDRDHMAATLTAILTDAPPHLWELRPDAPQALVSLIYRMLEKERDQRISSTRQVGAEMEAILRGEPSPSLQSASRFEPTTPISDLDGPTTITPTPTITPKVVKRRRLAIVGGILLLLLIAVGAFLVLDVPKMCCAPEPTPLAAASGEYIVLVADLEPIQTESREVARFIADDLKQQLEVEAPFSKMRVQRYSQVIKTDAEALAAAEATAATVVVWGNYTGAKITLNLQVGSLATFKYNQMDRTVLERTADVRVEMTDETQQSIAPQVLNVLAVLNFADGNYYDYGVAMVALKLTTVEPATVVGGSAAAHVHRYLAIHLSDPEQAVEELNQAIKTDGGNALLYALRSQANLTFATGSRVLTDRLELAERDRSTAQQLGFDTWALPYPITSGFYGAIPNVSDVWELVIRDMTVTLERRPDDWFLYLWRATYYYADNQFDLAKADLEQSIVLKPDAGYPYGLAAQLALREGRLADAAGLAATVITQFPAEPTFLTNLPDVFYGKTLGEPLGKTFPVFSNLVLGQYEDTISAVGQVGGLGDIHLHDDAFMIGVAQCNLGNYAEAQAAYDIILGRLTDFVLANLMAAEAQLRLGNRERALQQIAIIQRSDQADLLAPFAAAVMNGEFGCKDLFDSAKIAEIQEKYGSVTGETISATLTALAPTPEATATP
jgi:tetratricopeptide (TPR) repeat protein